MIEYIRGYTPDTIQCLEMAHGIAREQIHNFLLQNKKHRFGSMSVSGSPNRGFIIEMRYWRGQDPVMVATRLTLEELNNDS